jgi:hypothetical protein
MFSKKIGLFMNNSWDYLGQHLNCKSLHWIKLMSNQNDRSESLHESFLNSRVSVNENKSCMRVDESWEARVCMRVFSTLMSRSTRTRVAWELITWWELRSESLHESFLNSHFPVNENKSCMRVDESWEARFYMRVFSTLMPRSTRTRVAW